MRGLEEGVVRTEGDPVEMWEFLTCVLQQGYLPRWLGWWRDERLDAMKMVEKVEGVPPVWVVQGEQDSVVSGGVSFTCNHGAPHANSKKRKKKKKTRGGARKGTPR